MERFCQWHDEHPFLICVFLPAIVLTPFFLRVFLVPIIFIWVALSPYGVITTNAISSTFYSPRPDSIFDAVVDSIVWAGTSCYPHRLSRNCGNSHRRLLPLSPLFTGLTALGDVDNSTSARTFSHTNLIMKAIGRLLTTLLVALSCVYVLARLALLVKGLVLLRTAFLAVDRTKYLPSFNV